MVIPGELLTAALRYAELGYQVFPCAPSGKAPLTEHGFHDATSDAEQIERWWTQHPSANIGIPTEGLLVIDIDGEGNPWPGDPERSASLAQTGAVSLTPRGGRHYLFRRPGGKTWKCSTGKLAASVDVRTDGGYIVVPPSRTAHGDYRWARGLELDEPPDRLPEPPAWLIAELDALTTTPNPWVNGTSTSGTIAASGGEANSIPEHHRNVALASLAGTMRRVGMTRSEILAALCQVNDDRCRPRLEPAEVERIATSVARYEPDQIATAMAEGHWDQPMVEASPLVPVSLADLMARYPELRPPVIHGLLRRGETMNIIASSKTGKSWMVIDLALAVATGRPWLDTFETDPGNVLIIDNELHGETSANRIPKVAAARQIGLGEIGQRVFVQNLRGHWQDIFSLGPYFRSLEPGRFRVIILDAMYRFMPREMDENDNGTMANVYNAIDRYADLLGCCFVLIHHTSKGNQSGKAITDVGAGAGSQSRATDTHLVLRPHEEDDVVVLEAAVRSWPPVTPRCLRWAFPVWTPADDLDPTLLRSEQPKRKRVADQQPAWDIDRFTTAFINDEPRVIEAILIDANAQGINDLRAKKFLRAAEAAGRIYSHSLGRGRLAYATQPPANVESKVEVPKSRGAQVEELLRESPDMSSAEIAERFGLTKRHVNRLRRALERGTGGGTTPGHEGGTRDIRIANVPPDVPPLSDC